jgi:signal transduction histidine kinase
MAGHDPGRGVPMGGLEIRGLEVKNQKEEGPNTVERGSPAITVRHHNVLSGREVTAVLDHQTAVMEDIAAGTVLAKVLDSVVCALEELMPASRCSVLLLDDAGMLRHASAPTLPAAYSAAIDGLEPGPSAGSCGTAAHFGEPVIAIDVTTDPRWVQFRPLAAENGLRACWSSPIRCRSNVVGTFAVYHMSPYEPDQRDAELVRRFTHLASLAVEHGQVSTEREARHAAEVARQSAEQANRAKSQFVTALSHELRTPLQAITGFTENLQTLDLSAEQRHLALERIGLASAHILSIVDDVLDLARVEAGAMPINLCELEAQEVITASLNLIAPLTERRNVIVERSGPPITVNADRRRLQQVILNVMSNAVRFSPVNGTIRIATETGHEQADQLRLGQGRGPGLEHSPGTGLEHDRERDHERHHEQSRAHGHGKAPEDGSEQQHKPGNEPRNENSPANVDRCRIHVIDQGPGIPSELLARLFVPFDRLGADAGREGGAGLGLVLARRLTEAMGATFELASTVGFGTHITITFPPLKNVH